MKRRNLTTYPQMFAEGWGVANAPVVREILGQTSLEGRYLVVDGGDGVYARNQRIRELSRARWGREELAEYASKTGIDPVVLFAAEEFRLVFNQARVSKGHFALQFSKGTVPPEVIENWIEEIDLDQAELLPLAMAYLGPTEGEHILMRLLEEKIPEGDSPQDRILKRMWRAIAQQVASVQNHGETIMGQRLRKGAASFDRTEALAAKLLEIQQAIEAEVETAKEDLRNLRKGPPRGKANEIVLAKRPHRQTEETKALLGGSGRMILKIPPMVMPVKAKNKIARHRVTEEGILPFQIYRLASDGKVFLDPRKTKGGTVIVDISGSMGLSPKDVYEFVLKCPGATIAQYSGSGLTGTLMVVAHKGRIVDKRLIGRGQGGNIIDAPALEWLSRQAKPRVWVSDTHVTGEHDNTVDGLRDLCLDWCRKHQIKIVTSFDVQAVERALHTSHRKLLAAVRRSA